MNVLGLGDRDLRKGEQLLLAGEPATGRSSLLLAAAHRTLARGGRVLVCAPELAPGEVAVRLLQHQLNAGPERVHELLLRDASRATRLLERWRTRLTVTASFTDTADALDGASRWDLLIIDEEPAAGRDAIIRLLTSARTRRITTIASITTRRALRAPGSSPAEPQIPIRAAAIADIIVTMSRQGAGRYTARPRKDRTGPERDQVALAEDPATGLLQPV